ncbi:glycosyltransferase family 4 protein [Patescibacteria group bacterium]|nr:glycosyltransferase family 4 protein [Patescibacteria group bacterium]
MRLLVLTQKIDLDDDLLGFFHGWLLKLAPRAQNIIALALGVGRYDLPNNIKVFSLGKESADGNSGIIKKLKYTINFYRLIWRFKKDYDIVFVHMNVEYVLLGGLLWRLWRKKIVLWYAHYKNPLKLKLAVVLAHRVVTSTALACRINSEKLSILQQGIDTEKFKPENIENLSLNKILFLGRISPVKKLEVLIGAIKILANSGTKILLDVLGEPAPGNEEYFKGVKNLVQKLGLEREINFLGRVPNFQTPQIYRRHSIFVNLTSSGSFDKTMLEAMSCGLIIFVSNRVFKEVLPPDLHKVLMFREGDSRDLADKISKLLVLEPQRLREIKKQMRESIVKNQNLDRLIEKLVGQFKEINHE